MGKIGCHHCGTILNFDEKVFRSDTCSSCGSDLHCCLNCLDYAELSSDQCRESQAERVALKDHRNFCEYFAPRSEARSGTSRNRAEEARAKLEKLFQKRT
ncbi:MAG: hypothetical protein QG577_2465 [Thermodesulfobacteriota bacterium]|nr:hypothetical protein [Thermodesulfobacteriota bacterium]